MKRLPILGVRHPRFSLYHQKRLSPHTIGPCIVPHCTRQLRTPHASVGCIKTQNIYEQPQPMSN